MSTKEYTKDWLWLMFSLSRFNFYLKKKSKTWQLIKRGRLHENTTATAVLSEQNPKNKTLTANGAVLFEVHSAYAQETGETSSNVNLILLPHTATTAPWGFCNSLCKHSNCSS